MGLGVRRIAELSPSTCRRWMNSRKRKRRGTAEAAEEEAKMLAEMMRPERPRPSGCRPCQTAYRRSRLPGDHIDAHREPRSRLRRR